MQAEIKGNKLVITVELNTPPVQSSSGKTLLVASESGKTNLQVQGKQVSVTVNAYIKP
jgi:hypothetical protein